MRLANKYWCNCLNVYYTVKEEGTKAITKFFGQLYDDIVIHVIKPTLPIIPMLRTSYPRDFNNVCKAIGPQKDAPQISPVQAMSSIISTTDRIEEAILGLGHRTM